MKYVHNFSSISLFNFNQKIICYFRHMKDVWSRFLDHDKNKMQLIDRVIVEVVKFIASRTLKKNAQQLLNQIQSGEIFGIFNKKNRNQIWNELIFTKHFISFFRSFLRDVDYLNALTNNVKLLMNLAPNDIIFAVFSKTLNQEFYDVVIQIAEFNYRYQSASSLNKMNLNWRQLMIFAMRNYRDLPKRSKKKNFLAKSIFAKNNNTLNAYAHLADRLGYDISAIIILKKNMHTDFSSSISHWSLLVTDRSGVSKKSKKCGFSMIQAYTDDRQWLYIDNLHAKRVKQKNDITSFFIRKCIYRFLWRTHTATKCSSNARLFNTAEGRWTTDRTTTISYFAI